MDGDHRLVACTRGGHGVPDITGEATDRQAETVHGPGDVGDQLCLVADLDGQAGGVALALARL